MSLFSLLTIQTLWLSLGLSGQRFPSWGHYDLCKTQVHGDQGLSWDYMACQPEVTQLTKFLKISLDPPNSTCGESPEMYCTLENPYMCNNECDARTPELAHPPELMVDDEGRVPNTFWQSVSWRQFPEPLLVNLTLSWGKSIELTEDIIITFESGRPEQMVLEKSLDHGHTWQPYQFYAVDCLNSFGMESRRAQDLTAASVLDIICTEDYSRGYVWKLEKTVRFEIQVRFALFGGPQLSDMASLYSRLDTTKELRDFFTVTDLRLRLLRPATGPTSIDPLNLSKYFYAISNLDIRGRCKCHLHANNCILENGRLSCECEHNTTGQDCDSCKNGYHRRPWTPGSYLPIPRGTANACLPDKQPSEYCQCNPDGSLHRRCNDTGYCDCKAGAMGPKCDKCLPGYYWHRGCQARVCDNVLTRCENGGVCEDNGRCLCHPPYTGLLCEKHQCKKGAGACVSQSPSDPSFTYLLLSLTALLITANDHGTL